MCRLEKKKQQKSLTWIKMQLKIFQANDIHTLGEILELLCQNIYLGHQSFYQKLSYQVVMNQLFYYD